MPKRERVMRMSVEQPLWRIAGHAQPQHLVARAVFIDQRRRPEALGEAPQLAPGGRAFVEVHEVHRDAALGEEALRLAGRLAVAKPEDLDVHAVGSSWRAFCRSACQTSSGTWGLPRVAARPVWGPW